MSSTPLTILHGGHRKVLRIGANDSMSTVVQMARREFGLDSASSSSLVLKHKRNVVDLSQPFRFTGIPQNATLQLEEGPATRRGGAAGSGASGGGQVRVAMRLPGGGRVQASFSCETTLAGLLAWWAERGEIDTGVLQQGPSLQFMRTAYGAAEIESTTLRSIGLQTGSAMFTLSLSSPRISPTSGSKPAVAAGASSSMPSAGRYSAEASAAAAGAATAQEEADIARAIALSAAEIPMDTATSAPIPPPPVAETLEQKAPLPAAAAVAAPAAAAARAVVGAGEDVATAEMDVASERDAREFPEGGGGGVSREGEMAAAGRAFGGVGGDRMEAEGMDVEAGDAAEQPNKPDLPAMGVGTCRAALEAMVAGHFDSDSAACVITLAKMVDNVVHRPDDARTRQIRCANATFQQKVGRIRGGTAFLEGVGFVSNNEEEPHQLLGGGGSGAGGGGRMLVLTPDREDLALLKEARVLLTKQAEVLGVPRDRMPQPPRAPARPSPPASAQGIAFDPYKPFMTSTAPTPKGSQEQSSTEKRLEELRAKKANVVAGGVPERNIQRLDAATEDERGVEAPPPPPQDQVRTLAVGDTFASKRLLTAAVKLMVLADGGRNATCESGGKRQAAYRCAGRVVRGKEEVGCRFRITACLQTRGDRNDFKVTSVHNRHDNCSGAAARRRPGAAVLTELGAGIVAANPKISDKALAASIKARVGHEPTQWTSNRIKNAVLEEVNLERAESYHMLPSFLDELMKDSGGSITSHEWNLDGTFKRCFMMLGQSARVAARSPHQVFAMDCCHLRGHWNGVLCLLTVRNANDEIVVVCATVSAVENESVYDYTIENALRNDDMASWLNKPTTTFVLDGRKGSAFALPKGLPLAEARGCLRGLTAKVTPALGKMCTELVFEAARADNERTFEEIMDKVKRLKPESYAKMMAYERTWWANYACRDNVTWDQVTSNFSESANVMLQELRERPVFDMLKGLVEQCAAKLHEQAELMKDSSQIYTPFYEKIYNTELDAARKLDVKTCSAGVYLVSERTHVRGENKVRFTWATEKQAGVMLCTCGFIKRWNLLCRHLLAVLLATKTLHRATGLAGEDFKLEKYRSLAYTPELAVNVPIWSQLRKDSSKLQPKRVPKAGRPATPARKKAKLSPSLGDNASSPMCNTAV